MPDSSDDTRLHLGRVDGRLSALESRFDRHEHFVTQKLASIEDKLDRALLNRARNAGMWRAVHWIASAAISLLAWLVGHLTGAANGGH
jgi:hypothetical protein